MDRCHNSGDSADWLARWVPAIAVALPMVVLFGPVLFSDRLFTMRDAGHYYYPLFKWCADEWGAGRVPLWNPLENCGTAIHADPTASIWYPGKLVFALPVDFALRFKLYIIGHVILCAAASYWLARKWGASAYGSALAALSYSCGGSVVFQHCNVVYLVGAAWLPVAAGLVDDVVRERRARSSVWLGVVLALMVLGGDPQIAYHVLLAALVYAVVFFTSGLRDCASRSQVHRGTILAGGLIVLSTTIAFCLAAVQVLPSAEAASASERALFQSPRNVYEAAEVFLTKWGTGELTDADIADMRRGLVGPPDAGSHQATVYEFSVGPWRLAELVWPTIGGRMYPTHRRWFSLLPDDSRIWSPTLHLGLLPLVLGLSVFGFRGADVRIRWLSWLVLIFVLGSFGTYGIGWLLRHLVHSWTNGSGDFPVSDGAGGVYSLLVAFLPKYVLFRYPAKLFVVAALAIAQLAAIGWDRALIDSPKRLIWLLSRFGVASAAAAMILACISQGFPLGEGASDPVFGPFDSRGAWIDILTSLAHAGVVAWVGAWLLTKASRGRQPSEANHLIPQLAPAAILILCAIELSVANQWLVPTAPASLWREPSAVAASIGPTATPPRLYRESHWWPAEFSQISSANRLEQLVRWERNTLAARYALLDRIGIVNFNEPAEAADYEHLRQRLLPANEYASQWFLPTNLEGLSTDFALLKELHRLSSAERVGGDMASHEASLWRLTASAPRVLIPENVAIQGDGRTIPPDARVLAFELMKYERVRREEASVEGDLKLFDQPQIVRSGNPPRATILIDSPQRITIAARLPWWNLVVLNDRYAPGWRAFVRSSASEGQSVRETPIYRTNGFFRGVYLPAGEHTIEFRYEPRALYWGAWISGLSWAVLVLGAGVWWWRRRRLASPIGTPAY